MSRGNMVCCECGWYIFEIKKLFSQLSFPIGLGVKYTNTRKIQNAQLRLLVSSINAIVVLLFVNTAVFVGLLVVGLTKMNLRGKEIL